jgi:hypothetical protein
MNELRYVYARYDYVMFMFMFMIKLRARALDATRQEQDMK